MPLSPSRAGKELHGLLTRLEDLVRANAMGRTEIGAKRSAAEIKRRIKFSLADPDPQHRVSQLV